MCSVDGCDRRHVARGYCDMHYRRWKSHGDPYVREPASRMIDRKPRFKFLLSLVGHTGDACVPWPFSVVRNGYGQYAEAGRAMSAHRKMCLLAHGDPPNQDMHAAHSCNNRRCVNPNHLSWKTSKENANDRWAAGTMINGEKNPNQKLTDDDVREIRRMAGAASHSEIASKFGVKREVVSKILSGKRWAWLDSETRRTA